MLSTSEVIAWIALFISLVALIAATLQVLQQYSATADGYRRCQPSVMGGWARFTKRRFRWSEHRFETIFAVPVIFLYHSAKKDENCPLKGRLVIDIDGSSESYGATLLSKSADDNRPQKNPLVMAKDSHTVQIELEGQDKPFQQQSNRWTRFVQTLKHPLVGLANTLHLNTESDDSKVDNEFVSWIHFVRALQQHQEEMSRHTQRGFQPSMVNALQTSRRSWDFMPPGATKPFAISNVGDVAIMIAHLGLSWKEFAPHKGVMSAEGNNCFITSTFMRSLGIVLSFSADSHLISDRERRKNVYVPSLRASLLAFGLMPRSEIAPVGPFHRTPYEAFPVGSVESFDRYLKSFCGYTLNTDTATKNPGIYNSLSVVSEFVALVAPVLRMRNSTITRIFRPTPNIGHEILSSQSCLQAFQNSLMDLVSTAEGTHQRLQVILKDCSKVLDHPRWSGPRGQPCDLLTNDASIELLDILHDAVDETTDFLKNLTPGYEVFLEGHLRELFTLKDSPLQDEDRLPASAILRESLMDIYFDRCRRETIRYVQKLQRMKLEVTYLNACWVSMIFRSLCWYNLHSFKFKCAIVDPRYLESKIPVYIG